MLPALYRHLSIGVFCAAGPALMGWISFTSRVAVAQISQPLAPPSSSPVAPILGTLPLPLLVPTPPATSLSPGLPTGSPTGLPTVPVLPAAPAVPSLPRLPVTGPVLTPPPIPANLPPSGISPTQPQSLPVALPVLPVPGVGANPEGAPAGFPPPTAGLSPGSSPGISGSLLGPMPDIQPAVDAGNPESWETPDRPDRPLVRPAAYTLAPGDRINVAIATVPEFSAVYQVMVDGRITLPVLGQVDVQGMTEPEAALHIAQLYTNGKILVKPTITVVLAEMSNLHVAVLGEVNRPGAYIITPQNGELPQLTEIIEKAGGITQQTDLQNIQIRRPQRNGKDWVIQTSLWKLLTTGDLSQDLAIRDGDTITLQAAQEIPSDVALKVGRSNVATGEVRVNLLGEIVSPGVQTVAPGTSLNQAILLAGGLTDQANKKSIELLRLNPNGTVSQRKIKLNYNQSIDNQLNPILQDRDVILVERSMGSKLVNKIGNFLAPVNSIFSLFNLFSPFFPKSR